MWLAQPFVSKAHKMVRGRAEQRFLPSNGRRTFCVHCASLGEFEQGRPLIEALRARYPDVRLVLTFFSPSGYDVRHNYQGVDDVYYLPLDRASSVRNMLDALSPEKFFIIKYEYWFNLLKQLNERGCELYLVSAIFRPRMRFFASRWRAGGFFRSMLDMFTHIFVQDEASQQLLERSGVVKNVSIVGDTRFDRVAALSGTAIDVPMVADFTCGGGYTIVCGSTWSADEDLLLELMRAHTGWRFVVVPHEISDSRIERLIERSGRSACRYSHGEVAADATLLVVDTVGLLSSLYRYGQVAYIGGGFGVGIHNTLEAATWGVPIVFGPCYSKFREAVDMVALGSAFSISDALQLDQTLCWLEGCSVERGSIAARYVEQNIGATQSIMQHIKA